MAVAVPEGRRPPQIAPPWRPDGRPLRRRQQPSWTPAPWRAGVPLQRRTGRPAVARRAATAAAATATLDSCALAGRRAAAEVYGAGGRGRHWEARAPSEAWDAVPAGSHDAGAPGRDWPAAAAVQAAVAACRRASDVGGRFPPLSERPDRRDAVLPAASHDTQTAAAGRKSPSAAVQRALAAVAARRRRNAATVPARPRR